MCKRYVLISLIFAMIQKMKIISGEWVEIPQFSDETKVYRLPFNKYINGENYFVENTEGSSTHIYQNTSNANQGFRRITINQQAVTKISSKPDFNIGNTASFPVTTETVYKYEIAKPHIVELTKNVNDHHGDDVFEDDAASVEVVDEETIASPTTIVDDGIVVDKDQPHQSFTTARPVDNDVPESDDNEKTSFLAYMPIELFKKVHATLKSQPSSVKGKLSFLKRFEITLLAEIEKRLVPVINPPRRKRDSRGDHGWDEHDDSVGFPSLEGALMAISFLTFAVYLVQLVMMLFTKLGNPASAVPTATVLFNRNKRSTEQLTENTARILGYIDKFSQSQFHRNN